MPSTSWDRKRAAHLYRRAGFGATPDELDLAVSLGREGAVSRLVDFDGISTNDLEAFLSLYALDLDTIGGDRGSRSVNLLRWWYLRMQYTPRPLEEKMTLFWHNHFATSNDKVDEPARMYAQNQTFRTLGMGRFGDLLLAVSRDPAMLIWLDNVSNVKQAPNENFAREVMELFTMGVGHYTQTDVTEAARAFTGWTIDFERTNQFYFDTDAHDYGLKVFLGAYGAYTGEAILAILAARHETSAFITTKLARFFLGSDPSPALAGRLQNLFLSSGGEIRSIVREILLSDDFDATADAPDMIKSPVEIIVGARRSLGVFDDPGGYLIWPELMGMALFRPPNVGGWKGGRSWVQTSAYLIRISIAWSIVTQPSRSENFRWDVSRFFENRRFASADELIAFLVDKFNLIEPSEGLLAALRGYLALSGDPFVWTPQSYDYFGRGAIYFVMASPEYQLQ